MTTLGAAIAFAAEAHRLQTDKQGIAYILHPVRVADALRRHNWPETYQVAAALHDTVEDTETTLEDIETHFGELIRKIVDHLSQRVDPDTGEKAETYKEYVGRCCENRIARVVKRYDVYDNADPLRYCKESPIGRYAWTLDYIEELDARDKDKEGEL